MKKLSELQENSERQFSKISKKKYTIKMRLLTKETEIISILYIDNIYMIYKIYDIIYIYI